MSFSLGEHLKHIEMKGLMTLISFKSSGEKERIFTWIKREGKCDKILTTNKYNKKIYQSSLYYSLNSI